MLVSIGDVNDNSPLFTKETIVVTLDENNNDYLVVAKVTANDNDEGSNGRVAYRIAGGNRNNIFDINSASVRCLGERKKLLDVCGLHKINTQLLHCRDRWWQKQGS